jgi:tetraacyldisaccharide-1-P 4'-kinase
MARPIKETLVLTGKDSVRFEKMLENNKSRRATPEEIQRGKDAYKLFGFDKVGA